MGYPNHPKVATVHRRGFNYGNLKRPPKGFERSIFRLRPLRHFSSLVASFFPLRLPPPGAIFCPRATKGGPGLGPSA